MTAGNDIVSPWSKIILSVAPNPMCSQRAPDAGFRILTKPLFVSHNIAVLYPQRRFIFVLATPFLSLPRRFFALVSLFLSSQHRFLSSWRRVFLAMSFVRPRCRFSHSSNLLFFRYIIFDGLPRQTTNHMWGLTDATAGGCERFLVGRTYGGANKVCYIKMRGPIKKGEFWQF